MENFHNNTFDPTPILITTANIIAFNPSDLVVFLSSLHESDLRDFQESLTEEETVVINNKVDYYYYNKSSQGPRIANLSPDNLIFFLSTQTDLEQQELEQIMTQEELFMTHGKLDNYKCEIIDTNTNQQQQQSNENTVHKKQPKRTARQQKRSKALAKVPTTAAPKPAEASPAATAEAPTAEA